MTGRSGPTGGSPTWRRRAHDLRRTFISLARADGADEGILKRGTHAPGKDIMSLYTSVEWDSLCREVAKLQLIPRAGSIPKEELEQDLPVAFRVLAPLHEAF